MEGILEPDITIKEEPLEEFETVYLEQNIKEETSVQNEDPISIAKKAKKAVLCPHCNYEAMHYPSVQRHITAAHDKVAFINHVDKILTNIEQKIGLK